MSYAATVTTLGLAKIATAISTSTPLELTTMKLGDGDGSATSPSASDTDLVNVVFSGTPSRVDIDPENENLIICEITVPASEGGWTVREIGIFDGDGDLIAISQHPEIVKPDASEGATIDLICRLYFIVSNTAAVTLVIDSSVVIATRSWVTSELNNLIPGGTTDQILTKITNADGDYEWRDPTDINVVVSTIEEEQTLTGSQTVVNLSTCTTDGLAVYVEGIRLHPPDWTATSATVVTLATTYANGSKIYVVQNEPNSESAFLARGQNLADVPNKSVARANLELLTNSTYLDALWALMQQRSYPVGELLTTRRAGNPSSWMGFGTWERYGQGRVLVGYDAGDSSFNALDLTGGAKTHVLTEGEIPAHRHRLAANSGDLVTADRAIGAVGSVTVAASGTYPRSGTTTSVGGGQAHNNLQPYITVFMWKRTA